MTDPLSEILSPERLQGEGSGPLYIKLRQTLADAIQSGRLADGQALSIGHASH